MSDIHFLKRKNHHPRDNGIEFEEGPHIYTVLGERGTYTSVTTWVHSHFNEFDADLVIDKMLAGKNMLNPEYKYYGMSREEIKAMWEKKKNASCGAGTNMHYDIECYYNGMNVENKSIEFQYFLRFAEDHAHLKPYRTEWMVYYEELKISGSIDMVFEDEDGTIQIFDWKRCEEISYENSFGKNAITPCISHFPDTNFWHYSLQLNTYRRILEDKYEKKVSKLCLVCLHPNNHNKSYQCFEVPILEKEMNELFEIRKKTINKNI